MDNGNGFHLCGGTPPPNAQELPEKCPKCGSKTMYGYGLAGGGMGAYVMCPDCDFFAKRQDKEAQ